MPRSIYLRTVFGSRPVRRAIAVIVSPCRCNSRIIISSPSWTIGAASPERGDGIDVGPTIQPGRAPAEWLAEMPTREFSMPTIRENRWTDDSVLVEHRVDDVDERLIAVDQTMTAAQQVT